MSKMATIYPTYFRGRVLRAATFDVIDNSEEIKRMHERYCLNELLDRFGEALEAHAAEEHNLIGRIDKLFDRGGQN